MTYEKHGKPSHRHARLRGEMLLVLWGENKRKAMGFIDNYCYDMSNEPSVCNKIQSDFAVVLNGYLIKTHLPSWGLSVLSSKQSGGQNKPVPTCLAAVRSMLGLNGNGKDVTMRNRVRLGVMLVAVIPLLCCFLQADKKARSEGVCYLQWFLTTWNFRLRAQRARRLLIT